STHAFVLEQRKELKWPADLYLEGSDQHRGWFHSSMLESCATRGRAPCNHILTHGFVLAEDGQKMSKSIGNVITPETVIKQYGADILRLWVVASNYHDDLSIGPSTLKQHSETYRRLRNCLRWLLGNLNGYSPSPRYTFNDKKEIEHLEEPERWILNQLSELSEFYEKQIKNYQFHLLFKALHHFCTHDLSAFYFDIRKDSLYCDDLDDPLRQSILGVLDQIFNHLVRWLAPILCFTSEEAWITRMEESANPDDLQKESIHLQNFVPYNLLWRDLKLADKWKKLRQIRKVILGAIEIAREQKILGASLEAKIRLYVPSDQEFDVEVDLLTIVTIVSQSEIVKEKPPKDAFCLDDVPGYAVVVERAHGQKCQRCWNIFQPATKDSCQKHNDLCARCQRVIDKIDLKS
ncbi:MAG: class I tRNA ligase family protein, partial [Pseudomonadota bacterium]